MNAIFLFLGTLTSFLLGFITLMSRGLSLKACQFLDQITFSQFSLHIYEMNNGFFYDTQNNDMPTIMFLISFGIIFLLWWIAIHRVERRAGNAKTLGLIIVFAVLFRLIMLPGELIHENDIYRYMWDGKSMAAGINPYKYAPSDLFMYERNQTEDYYDEEENVTLKAAPAGIQDKENLEHLIELREANPVFYHRIGHWQVPTIYPPVAQLIFYLSSLIAVDSLLLLKFIFVLFDVGVIFLLIALLTVFKKNPNFVIVYAWCPLILKEVPNAGHYDSIAIFFTMLSLLLYFKGKEHSGIIALGLATLSKLYSIVLLPILLKSNKLKYVFSLIVILGIFYMPFLFWDEAGFQGVFEGLNTYNQFWSYNSSVYAIVWVALKAISPELVESHFLSKAVVGILYLMVLGAMLLNKSARPIDLLHKCFWAVALLFLFNPVGDPWYFCWAVPFLCFFRYRSWLLLSGLLVLSYLNFHSDIAWVQARYWDVPAVSLLIYGIFFAVFFLEFVPFQRSGQFLKD